MKEKHALKVPPTYRYFKNTSGKTSVLGTKHVNVNLWLPSHCTLKLTQAEVDESGLEKYSKFEEVTDAKKIKEALRPDAARKSIITNKFKKIEDEQKARNEADLDPEADSYSAKPVLAKLDPLSGKPMKANDGPK